MCVFSNLRCFVCIINVMIDFHVHVFDPFFINNRESITDSFFESMYSDPKAKMATADDLIANMDEYGIEKAVVCNMTWRNDDYCNRNNYYIINSAKKYPDRIIPFIALPYEFTQLDVQSSAVCFNLGVMGIGEQRLPLHYLASDNSPVDYLASVLKDANRILLLHVSEPVGHQYPGKEKITPEALYGFLTRSVDTTKVLAHFGGGFGFYALMKEVKQVLSNCYFDTAATPYLYEPDIYNVMDKLVTSDRILFGTDFPLMTPKKVLDHIGKGSVSDEDYKKITHQNAEKLLERIG